MNNNPGKLISVDLVTVCGGPLSDMKCILKRMLASASLLALAAVLPCAGQVAFTTNPAPGVKRRWLPKSILESQHEEKSCTPSTKVSKNRSRGCGKNLRSDDTCF
jgi:hypothetical protein